MSKYIMRLDDASDFMDVEKWQQMEVLLDRYNVLPLVGIIPQNQDPTMVEVYKQDLHFWEKVRCWQDKGWTLALHGAYHTYTTEDGGINPVNRRSEFAGLPLETQRKMIRHGVEVLASHGIEPKVFFAPSHTFDRNTLRALEQETNIRIISDTIANDVYYEDGFYFIPQQSGGVRRMPLKTVTFCYHPNMMNDESFVQLEAFLVKHKSEFVQVKKDMLKKRKRNIWDLLLKKMYFVRRS